MASSDQVTLTCRAATKADLPAMLALLSDDTLGTKREAAVTDERYLRAWDAIAADPHQHLVVAELGGEVVGMLQVTRTPGLSRAGAWRATIESVRIRADLRGRGHGETLMRFAIELARTHGCRLVQLTSDQRRTEAHRFYGRLGFKASHTGFKLELP
ncbi:MAG: GNAT family N-acetyltransferase [Myxococcaceae bacterium]